MLVQTLLVWLKPIKKDSERRPFENLTKDWTGGYYHVLRSKSVVPRGGPLIAIGYKYNVRKIIYFIVIEVAGRKKSGPP